MLALWLAEQPLKLYQLTSCVYWKGRVQFSHNISQIVKDFVSMFWPLPIVIESKMYNRHFQSEFNRHHLIRVLFAVIWEISFDICWVFKLRLRRRPICVQYETVPMSECFMLSPNFEQESHYCVFSFVTAIAYSIDWHRLLLIVSQLKVKGSQMLYTKGLIGFYLDRSNGMPQRSHI